MMVKYSEHHKSSDNPTDWPILVELTDRHWHLDTPIGSAKFTSEFFIQRVNEVKQHIASLEYGVPGMKCII